MCGIVGIIQKDAKKYSKELSSMVKKLKHRGPDEKGAYFFNSCALGHTRLSIVDLKSGQQPMLNNNSDTAIVFNGEIYGYKDIKKNLNYNYKTNSDTEVILSLYEKYGFDTPTHLPGMFSFAIWDDKNQELFCARDRFGEKPFYYAIGKNNEFIFASEIKSILASNLITPILDTDSLTHYLKHLYISPTKTIYKNIFTLPPAHKLTYTPGVLPSGRKNNKIHIERYWDVPEINKNIKLDETLHKFNYLLEKSVKSQLVADVPVGVFLSGGMDSSAITALASHNQKNIKTFSFGFENSFNELNYAKEVSKKFNTDHTELLEDDFNIANLIVEMQDIYDEPFADSSNIPTYLISKAAKQHVKTVLTGDGGDELFGGYTSWYKPLYYMQSKNDFSNFLASTSNLKTFYYFVNGIKYRKKYRNLIDAHVAKNTYFSNSDLESLNLKNNDSPICNNNLESIFNYDIKNYMPGDILAKTDRASMANGIELRSPFLDVDFANFCLSLPLKFKITRKNDKFILKEAFKDKLPENIINRKKQGFGSPVDKWLKTDSVEILINEYLKDSSKKIFKILPFDKSQIFINKNNYQTWILLILSIWMEKHEFQIPSK